jgi:hypothetical protein
LTRRGGGLLLAAALGLFGACKSAERAPPAVRFTEVAEGVEYARLLDPQPGERRVEGHAFRVDLERAGLRVLAAGGPKVRREVSTIARAVPDVVAVNASFFDEDDRAMGLVVDQGRALSKRRRSAWGALVVTDRRASLVTGKEVDLEHPPHLAVQGFPRLLVDGEVQSLKPQAARRTAVCAEGRYVILVVVTKPVDATALAHFLARPTRKGGLDCENALNLDGGPSTQLFARLGELGVNVPGSWGAPNALAAIPGLPQVRGAPDAPSDGGEAVLDDDAAEAAVTPL